MITTLNYKLGAITNKTQRKPFSIMELIVYMVVVLFLIGVLFFGLPFLINQARVTTAKQEMDTLKTAVTAYQMLCVNPGENITAEDLKTGLTAAKTATQAQAYSDIVSEKIKLEGTDAEEVTTKTKLSEITGNDSDDDWFYTYEIENETEDDNGNIFKVASIKIYKDDENGPRYSTEIPLSSLGSGDSLEVGMVIAWTLATNPSDNYLECNGQSIDSTKYPKLYELMHNVPDYRGMFLRGLGGNSADLGELQNYALIEHTHEITMPASHGKSGNGGIPRFSDGDVWSNNKTKLTTGITDDIPIANEVRPINKAVRYFIKAK